MVILLLIALKQNNTKLSILNKIVNDLVKIKSSSNFFS
ncbi:hypothetical protein HNP50_000447 [Elizabethkingia anophelis]|nr:hypothetical protein [Elizabethkingia anophelis]MCW2466074.1 hypothetical protein [Elizabethkingia anophelis]MCW2469759.1 hypothetical protein [Elizabethkingia anophelis]